MLTKSCVVWGKENEVYDGVSITWVIYKLSQMVTYYL